MIDSLYFLQFACFIFMLINALILGITHLHMKWTNQQISQMGLDSYREEFIVSLISQIYPTKRKDL